MANLRFILGAKQTLKLLKMSHHKQSQASQTLNKSHSSQLELGTLIIQTRGHILVRRSFVSGSSVSVPFRLELKSENVSH